MLVAIKFVHEITNFWFLENANTRNKQVLNSFSFG